MLISMIINKINNIKDEQINKEIKLLFDSLKKLKKEVL